MRRGGRLISTKVVQLVVKKFKRAFKRDIVRHLISQPQQTINSFY